MIRAYISAAFAALISFVGLLLYRKGHKDADDDNQTKELNEYVETRKRIDEAIGPSDDDVSEWLRKRGGHKRDM